MVVLVVYSNIKFNLKKKVGQRFIGEIKQSGLRP